MRPFPTPLPKQIQIQIQIQDDNIIRDSVTLCNKMLAKQFRINEDE